jgi:hypothetical protein
MTFLFELFLYTMISAFLQNVVVYPYVGNKQNSFVYDQPAQHRAVWVCSSPLPAPARPRSVMG